MPLTGNTVVTRCIIVYRFQFHQFLPPHHLPPASPPSINARIAISLLVLVDRRKSTFQPTRYRSLVYFFISAERSFY
uniref:Uncharacterized protein n=1 Tax=Parascaris univalens TaxID=6257 RepID=A0A915CJ14_PARUN